MSSFPTANYLSDAARTQGEQKTAFEDFLAATKQIAGAGVAEQALTIASGVITPAAGASGLIAIDTEAAAATDDLTNVDQTNVPDGSILMLHPTSAARVVVIKHSAGGAGQISLRTAGDCTLGDPTHWLMLRRNGTIWEEIARFPSPMSGVVTRTSNTMLVAADIGKLIDITSGTFTQTYEACATLGKGWWIAVKNSGSGVITHDPNASETIDGASTLVQNAGDEMCIVCDGTQLKTFARYKFTAVDGPGVIVNGMLSVTVAGNALIFALKTKAGNDPSPADPVMVAFRSANLLDGRYWVRTITSALSFTLSAGSTIGTTNGVAYRIRAYLIDNAGTVELAAYHARGTGSLLGLDESALYTTTAEGGAGAADSAQILYSTTARTSVAVREFGFCEIIEAMAGTWATGPTVVHTAGPGTKRCGDMVQICAATYSTPTSSSSSTYADTGLTVTLPMTNACNAVEVDVAQAGMHKGTSNTVVSLKLLGGGSMLFQMEDDAADDNTTGWNTVGAAAIHLLHFPATLGSYIYKTTFASLANSARADVQFQNGATSSIRAKEIFA